MLPRLKTAEQFAAVMDASKQRLAINRTTDPQPERTQAEQKLQGVRRSVHFALHVAPPNLWPERQALQATIGVITPKRWAKRAVTRNCIKRQIYAVTSELSAQLPCAYYVVRQHTAYAREQFPSATSNALKCAVREELLQLLGKFAVSQATGERT